jgi:hypothetical protein
MAISKPWYETWSREKIEQEVPEESAGIYELGASWADIPDDIVYIGCSSASNGIQARLIDHLSGQNKKPGVKKFRFRLPENADADTAGGSQGIFESTNAFTTRLEAAHLRRFQERHGQLPRYNDRIPSV